VLRWLRRRGCLETWLTPLASSLCCGEWQYKAERLLAGSMCAELCSADHAHSDRHHWAVSGGAELLVGLQFCMCFIMLCVLRWLGEGPAWRCGRHHRPVRGAAVSGSIKQSVCWRALCVPHYAALIMLMVADTIG
jgi:hypothetical protein